MSRLILLFLLCAGCASSTPYMLPESDTDSQAPGEAFNPMTFRKAMPDRRDQKSWEFYYKHCALNGDEEPFSATAYDCSAPY